MPLSSWAEQMSGDQRENPDSTYTISDASMNLSGTFDPPAPAPGISSALQLPSWCRCQSLDTEKGRSLLRTPQHLAIP